MESDTNLKFGWKVAQSVDYEQIWMDDNYVKQ